MPVNFLNIWSKLTRDPKWVFVIVVIVVCALQFLLLNIILTFGLSYEEWLLLFNYKVIGVENFFDKLFATFNASGVYSTTYIFYIGILESIFKGNYQAYQITNIIFKTLATLSLYPLILILFKRRSLAFLTTILFAISYSSTGALQFVVKGSDYLAIFFMNICLITYYYSLVSNKRFTLFTTTLFLFLSFVFSPIRVYPFLIFIILVEFYVWIKFRGLSGLIYAILRLLLLFSPYLIILRYGPGSTSEYLALPLIVTKLISYGNYQLLLSPFAGLGYTFLPNDYWGIFGIVTFDNFKDYFSFLLRGPIIIYSALAILLGFLLTKKPLLYILGIIFANVTFEIICYFFVTNLKGLTGSNIKGFHPVTIYAIFLGFFVISIAISSLLVWLRKAKSNILLLFIFIGPVFSSLFLWGTWLIIGDNLTFKEGIHWYLIIPSIGSSLFLASLMILAFDRIKSMTIDKRYKHALIVCLFLLIIPIYLISSKEIDTTFTDLLRIGYGASEQEEMKNKLLSQIREPLDINPAFFYLVTFEDPNTPQLFYNTVLALTAGFSEKMHFKNWEIVNGCTALISDKDILEKSIVVQDGIKGFDVRSLCVADHLAASRPRVFYKPENFYAFKLKDKEVIDIKEDVLIKLGFK